MNPVTPGRANRSTNNLSRTPHRFNNSTTLCRSNSTLNRTLINQTQSGSGSSESRLIERVERCFHFKLSTHNLKNLTTKYVVQIMEQILAVLGIETQLDGSDWDNSDDMIFHHRLHLYKWLVELYRTLPENTPYRSQIVKYEFIIKPNRTLFTAFLNAMCNIRMENNMFKDEFIEICRLHDQADIELDHNYEQLNNIDNKEFIVVEQEPYNFIKKSRQLIEDRINESEQLAEKHRILQQEVNLVLEKFLK